MKENGARGSDAADESTQSDSDGGGSNSSPSPFGQQYFEVDHPFVFLVWDYYSGMVLLMGRVVTPDVLTTSSR